MESANRLNIVDSTPMPRRKALLNWLEHDCGLSGFELQPMHGDASFRCYYRIQRQAISYVVMDAPPPQENCHPYIAVAQALRQAGILTPDILHADLERGFLVLSDFGDTTYLKALHAENADVLYRQALDVLATLQQCQATFVRGHVIPPFTADFMWKEWAWHKEWFLQKLLGLSDAGMEQELDKSYAQLVDAAVSQPQVFMHRDFHSANLMVLPQQQVGVLDFQDAFIGPVTYDLASLLRDCYIDWPQERVQAWVQYYYQQLRQQGNLQGIDGATFMRWFDLMGMQRHLKALLTFARKKVRDHDVRYLQFIPRTLQYLINVSQQYSEFAVLHDYLQQQVKPACEKVLP